MQEIYLSRDFLEFIPRHQWPDVQLPVPQPPQPPQPSVNEEVLNGLQSTHDATVDMLCTQGLMLVKYTMVKCSFCSRVCKTTQKLKVHIRSHHLKSTAYNCSVCNKSFGDPYDLCQHKKSHVEGGRKFLCDVCGKGFVSKSQVNEHTKKHQQGRVTCAHCSKSLVDKKTLQDHIKVCPFHPQPSQQEQEKPQTEEQAKPHKCDHCYRRYVHRNDLLCHMHLLNSRDQVLAILN